MSYHNKYLKYKNKFINLKSQIGGDTNDPVWIIIDNAPIDGNFTRSVFEARDY